MIKSKKIQIIVAVAIVFAMAVSVIMVIMSNMSQDAKRTETPQYASEIFGTQITSIEILADEDDWQEMLDNAINEEYIMADVVVNGTTFENVGIRPKGNSSLTQVASSDSDRYSFRLQFDQYVKDQTCFGLDSFVVNNMQGDNTYIKEYVSYDLMKSAGVDTPYFNFASIKVNDKNWGLYLAVELYDESYEERTFGDTSGMLYNVKSMEMGGDKQQSNSGQKASQTEKKTAGEPPEMPDKTADSSAAAPPDQSDNKKTFGGQMGRDSSGGSLEYTDDETSSYSSIFDNVVGKGKTSDYKRVIKALKALSEGKDLETYFDVDQTLRYLAAHTLVVNLDSYSSSMAQNYYIYENDGKITILPWDYNLAWGGFQSGDASSVINFPIDTPVSGVELSERPLIEKLLSNSEYLETYHTYMQQLLDDYFADGKFEKKVNELNNLISSYVKNDSTAFCTYKEYQTAIKAFKTLGNLRAKSVQGQLDGTVPSTTSNQEKSPDKLISAGDLELSDLGSSMAGKKGGADQSKTDVQKPPENIDATEQKGQNRGTAARPEASGGAGWGVNTRTIIVLGVLAVLLAGALLFAAKFKKRY